EEFPSRHRRGRRALFVSPPLAGMEQDRRHVPARDGGQRMMLDKSDPRADARKRARAIKSAGGLHQALEKGALPKLVDTTLSEALILGLLKQGVRKYFAIFGHGSTDLGDVLRVYEEEGVTRTINCRNEVEMAHAATALRWQYGETSA